MSPHPGPVSLTSPGSCRRALAVLVAVLAGACTEASSGGSSGFTSSESALSVAQCQYFASGGKVKICHATSSPKNPYVSITVAVAGCESGHAGHANDYIDTGDGCRGHGALPPGAPCDDTLACSEGYECRKGTCEAIDLCVAYAVKCAEATQCQGAGKCDPATGKCSYEPYPESVTCNDESASTYGDHCDGRGGCIGNPVRCPADTTCRAYKPNGTQKCDVIAAPAGTKCDDGNPATSNDACTAYGACVGTSCTDADGDGYGVNCANGPDCDDERRDVNAGATEVCGNGLDDDCASATSDGCTSDPCPSGNCGVGCADGEREGFTDVAAHPSIAACAGGWSVPGVFQDHLPTCGRVSGDDSANPSGDGCTASDLCAAGWHVCRTSAEVGSRAGATGCGGVTAPSSFFASGQSGNGCGNCSVSSDPSYICSGNTCNTVCYPTSVQTNDVFGCGTLGTAPSTNCAPLNQFSHNNCSALAAPWSCNSNGVQEALNVVKTGPEKGGVLCCVD